MAIRFLNDVIFTLSTMYPPFFFGLDMLHTYIHLHAFYSTFLAPSATSLSAQKAVVRSTL